jgi:hypothetical protein
VSKNSMCVVLEVILCVSVSLTIAPTTLEAQATFTSLDTCKLFEQKFSDPKASNYWKNLCTLIEVGAGADAKKPLDAAASADIKKLMITPKDKEVAQKVVKALQKLLPGVTYLATALTSSWALGVQIVITPEPLTPDPIYVLKTPKSYSPEQRGAAARMIVRDFLPDTFKKMIEGDREWIARLGENLPQK